MRERKEGNVLIRILFGRRKRIGEVISQPNRDSKSLQLHLQVQWLEEKVGYTRIQNTNAFIHSIRVRKLCSYMHARSSAKEEV